MDCKSLMIGDWFQTTYPNGKTEYRQVRGIVKGDVAEHVIHDNGVTNAIEPIPLTAEILEKNGWKKVFDKVDYMVKYDLAKEGKNCWMMWAIKEHNLDIQRQDEKLDMYNLKVQMVCMPCDFVHELQRALRCCGLFDKANDIVV